MYTDPRQQEKEKKFGYFFGASDDFVCYWKESCLGDF